MQITVILSAALAADWRSSRALVQVLSARNKELRALHPDLRHSELSRYFVFDVDDERDAESTRDELAEVPGVEAAYIKKGGNP